MAYTRIDFNKPVRVKAEVLKRRSDMDHYRGITGFVDATSDKPSHCSVIWANKFRAFHNVSDLENVPTSKPTQPSERAEKRIADQIDGYDRDDLGESPDY